MHAESNSGSVLDRIVEARRQTIAHRKRVLPLVALIILLGVLPGPLVGMINAALRSNLPGILLRGW